MVWFGLSTSSGKPRISQMDLDAGGLCSVELKHFFLGGTMKSGIDTKHIQKIYRIVY